MGSLIETVITLLSRFVINTISSLGYAGILVTMAIESACIPLPSEIIMPFSGYLVTTGQFTMLGVTLAGALGNVIGSIAAYYDGVWGGRPFVERYGPYVLLSRRDLDIADRWFARYGEAAVFVSRLLPVVRTFISLPAGIARMNFPRFGVAMGERWDQLREYFHEFDIVIGLALALAVGYFLWSHWPKRAATPDS